MKEVSRKLFSSEQASDGREAHRGRQSTPELCSRCLLHLIYRCGRRWFEYTHVSHTTRLQAKRRILVLNYASYTARLKANVGSRVVVAPGPHATRRYVHAVIAHRFEPVQHPVPSRGGRVQSWLPPNKSLVGVGRAYRATGYTLTGGLTGAHDGQQVRKRRHVHGR